MTHLIQAIPIQIPIPILGLGPKSIGWHNLLPPLFLNRSISLSISLARLTFLSPSTDSFAGASLVHVVSTAAPLGGVLTTNNIQSEDERMATRTYKYGKHTCKAYKKAVGKGFEVGFTFGGHEVFVGNFIHTKEANAWWSLMNTEVRKFCQKYHAAPNAPVSWTSKFMSNYMYKAYYSYLDREFSKYQRGYSQAVKKDERHYHSFRKSWPNASHYGFRRAA